MSTKLTELVDEVNHLGEPRPEDVLETMHTLMHLARGQRNRTLRDARGELTPMEAKALGYFSRNPGATQRDLVAHAGRDKGQIARLIGALRERGLIEARPDAQDRRSQRLQLTASGRALQDEAQAGDRDIAAAAVEGLSEGELEQLRALLARLRVNLERRAGS